MEYNPNVFDPDLEEERIRAEQKDGITQQFLDRTQGFFQRTVIRRADEP